MRIAYFDCFSGASGDMILGALLDAGLPLAALRRELAKLRLHGFRLKTRRVTRGGLAGTKLDVVCDAHDHEHRRLSHILRILSRSGLSARVKRDASGVFRRLAEAEAKVHGTSIEEIHFHEVGAVDAIVDVVGACVALEKLGVERVVASPLPTGTGFVDCAHGRLPVPAPATAELLTGFPVAASDVEAELTTPTGAAILTTLADSFGPRPAMTPARVGLGAGSREIPRTPNLLRVFIGESVPRAGSDRVRILETNLDDLSPQVFETVMEKLFAAGALDAWTEPIQMKKGRPAVKLCVLAPDALRATVEEILFRETTTFGVRSTEVERSTLAREFARVTTAFGDLTVKLGLLAGRVVTVAPEYEDVKRAAAAHGVPLRAVMDEAREAAGWLAAPTPVPAKRRIPRKRKR